MRRRRRPDPSGPVPPPSNLVRRGAFAIFLVALALRLLFWRATPDRDWGWSATFKGDAPLWLDYARALQLGQPFELGLPIHPPGAAWLLALVWDGQPSGLPFVRFVWALLGALVPLLVVLSVKRFWELRVALVAGLLTAAATPLLVLSTSLNNETPYLVLVLATLWLVDDLLADPRPYRLLAWSVLHALACLFRAEHLLFYALSIGFLVFFWNAPEAKRQPLPGFPRPLPVRRVLASLVFFAAALVPWHLKAWGAIARFNDEPRALAPVEEAAVGGVEKALAFMTWEPEALARREALPGFARRTASAFVAATAAHRGHERVRGQDFEVLEEAFGYTPRPMARHPFVTLYGPLNFALANHAGAGGGFERGPLEEPPPLRGGAERYPRFLVQGLPPAQLTFFYPPHLRLFNEGYTIGWSWIVSEPAGFVRLAFRKLALFWAGAAFGLTGWGLPPGLSGPRPSVDMVVPEGAPANTWRVVVLLAALAGAVVARKELGIYPWLLYLASKVVVAVLFFGYARQGALVVPAVALLVALAARPLLRRAGGARPVAIALALLLAVEAGRFLSRPRVRFDGQLVTGADPVSGDDPRAVRVQLE